MTENYQNGPEPSTPYAAPDPKQMVINYLLKVLFALIGSIILVVGGYLFIYAPVKYMENSRFPMHMKWKKLAPKEISEQASKIFKETDKQAWEQGFEQAMIFSTINKTDYTNEEKIYISNDSRAGFIVQCHWYQQKKFYCYESLLTYFQDGLEVVTTNRNDRYHELEPAWHKVRSNPQLINLDIMYHNHLEDVEKVNKGGSEPILLKPDNIEVMFTSFQDKANNWRAEQGLLEKVPGQEVYQITYRTALNRILIYYKLRSVPK